MADIRMRFHRDMLVISGSLDASLARQGVDPHGDRQFLTLMEPDTLLEAYQLQVLAGAQCLATPTEPIAPARLAHNPMGVDPERYAQAALDIVEQLNPQHVLAEIGPCGLPLDASSKSSLNENRKQYADCARAFDPWEFDAYLLSGFTSLGDMKCALMGLRQVTDLPIMATMLVGEGPILESPLTAPTPKSDFSVEDINSGLPIDGYSVLDDPVIPRTDPGRGHLEPLMADQWAEAVDAMADLEASVIGFETAEPLAKALDYARIAASAQTPVAGFLRLVDDPLQAQELKLVPLEELQIYTPQTLPQAALALRDAGVQFLRATGDATPACTGALSAAVTGLDAVSPWQ